MTLLLLKRVKYYFLIIFLVILSLKGNLFSQTHTPKYPSGEVCTDGLDVLKSTGAQYSENISLAGRWSEEGEYGTICIVNDLAYYQNGIFLEIANILNPTNPMVLSSTSLPSAATDIIVKGKYAYIAAGSDGLLIYEISDPRSPEMVYAFSFDWKATRIYLNGDRIIDISDPENPIQAGIYDNGQSFIYFDLSGEYIYASGNGLVVLKYDPDVNGNEPDNEIEADFILHHNFPNPFNPTTYISFNNSEQSNVTLKIYNITGQYIKTLHTGISDEDNTDSNGMG